VNFTKRDAAKLLIAAGTAGALPGKAHAAAPASVGRVTVEWQIAPMALDTLRPRFKWTLIAPRQVRGLRQSAFRLTIADEDSVPLFDTGRLASSVMAWRSETDLPLRPQTRYRYSLEVWDQDGRSLSAIGRSFATGLLAADNNQGQWLAAKADITPRYGIEGHWYRVDTPQPLPLFRKALRIQKPVRQAHLCVTGLGQYQLWIDDRKVSPDGLNGGWTNYDKRVLYDAYDVSEWLTTGDHWLGLALGNGFFNVEAVNGRYSKFDGTFGRPQMWAQLRVGYSDGSEEIIASDASWEVRDSGTTFSSLYGGEDFDARLDDGRFDSGDWTQATLVKGPAGGLEGSTFRPMVRQSSLKPKSVTTRDGAIVFDFGLNHSGRPSINLKNMAPGTVIRLVPAELLGDTGLADQQSMVGGKVRGYLGIAFTYTARGGKHETWSPQYTYTGYRYLQVEGVDTAHIESIESHFLSNDVAKVGTFSCSDTRIELIHGLINQALLSNSASVLTDCPQREKLGWLEQIYLNGATAMMNRDMITVYEKMMTDIRDAQEPSGMVPTIAPEFTKFIDKAGKDTRFRDSPEWGAALILGAWAAFSLHGDTDILSQNYWAMMQRIAYLETRLGADGLLDYGLGDWYDIGPNNPGNAQLTSRKMTGTATFYAELTTLARIARKIAKPNGGRFEARAEALKATMQQALFDPARSVFDTGSQTAQSMALVLGLFPDEHRHQAMQMLIADIRARNNHVSAGDIGFHYLVRALTDGGRSDVLHDMLSRTDKPSYLDQIANGATALTEGWDAWREGSQNHFMLGHAEIWFYQGLGGLNIDFGRDADPIILAPQPVAGIDDQGATYESHLGRIACRLRRTGSRWRLTAEVPPNAAARIILPTAKDVRENRTPLVAMKGVSAVLTTHDATSLIAISGVYDFTWRE
jgi:alpha-L-rhamnosidase